LLSAATGAPPRDWLFSIGAHGKPEVLLSSGTPRLRVNISHTRGLAAVALVVEHDIGIDVEWLDRQPHVDELAERMFAEQERQQLAAIPHAGRTEAFLRFWTLKEAYVKAIGKGLSQPLDAFFFELDRPGIHFADPAADDPARWHFDQLRTGPEHLLALAVRHPAPTRLSVEAGPAPLPYLLSLATEFETSDAEELGKTSRR
jgi:4'-phosphopantetheinyl transferase